MMLNEAPSTESETRNPRYLGVWALKDEARLHRVAGARTVHADSVWLDAGGLLERRCHDKHTGMQLRGAGKRSAMPPTRMMIRLDAFDLDDDPPGCFGLG
jgi:hypothetical protein